MRNKGYRGYKGRYLCLPEIRSKVFTVSSEGEKNKLTPEPLYFTNKNPTTAISNVTDDNNLPARCYDLQGRCVAAPTRGLYIMNGKTYFLMSKNMQLLPSATIWP